VTIGLGTLLAFVLDSSAGIWLALLVGAALAPTDAALGAGMMVNPMVPARIRRLINVESGLNDGIATPFVSVALAGAATAGEVAGHGPAAALAELALGVVVGVVVGGGGGLVVSAARKRGWVAEGFAGPAALGLAVCAYATSVAVHGNGFIAAFVGGLAFGTASGRRGEPLVPFVEETGALVSLLVWLTFGAVAVAPAVEVLNWQIVLYAVLSLTVIRMAPVAVALVGSGLDRATIALVAWFGPRGLASVVFCLLALEELGSQAAHHAAAVISFTVVLSVVVHGATADPLAGWYARHLARHAGHSADDELSGIPERRLIRRAARRG
jgi:NhaP-type Na+/H+ or K+/H+ antiporter